MGEVTGIVEKDEGRGYDIWDGIIEEITLRKSAQDWVDFLNTLLEHDITNKIHIIHGYLSLLDKSDEEREQKALIQKALQASNESMTLLRKIRRIREFDKVYAVQLEQMDLIPLLKRVSDLYSEQRPSSGMRIDFEYEDRSYEILGSEFLSEIFSNLIENSVLHSSGGLLRISLIETEYHITVRFEDDGKGFPDDIKDRLFESGVKGPDSKGSGIGLFLVKKIIEGLNGEIAVNQSEMGGAQFDVTFWKA